MADGKTVVCVYKYLSLMFIFKVATKKTWMIIGNDRSQDEQVSHDQIEARYGENAPNLSLWDRFGLFFGIAAFLVILVLVGVLGG